MDISSDKMIKSRTGSFGNDYERDISREKLNLF